MTETVSNIRKHPGKGVGKARLVNRGREVNPQARAEVLALLGGAVSQRDLLIEHLHILQDYFGHLSAINLVALADLMNIPQAEVYEVATFYAHFEVVKEDQCPPPPLTIRVCDSLSCQLQGAETLFKTLQESTQPKDIRVLRAPCMGRCDAAPVAAVGHCPVVHATAQRVLETKLGEKSVSNHLPAITLENYRKQGGYRLLQAYRSGERSYESLQSELAKAGLRGMGGAGFATASKWDLVRQTPGPRLMVVNADEGEPGTFKDRHCLETDPHRFVEGMLIGAWAVEAEAVYIYLRDEYPELHQSLRQVLKTLIDEGLIESGFVHLRRGAGAYICGEESALIESLEGKRGYPRLRPPYVAEVGLFNRPTLVNNVESLFWVREIIERGAVWFVEQGRRGGKGLRRFSVSGRVNNPGVHLAPAGITAQELIDEYAGGMLEGHLFKAYLPGGASGGILPASKANLPLDFGTLEDHDCFIGSAAVVVLSDQDDMRMVALNLARFFADESCGQCTPCRVGCEKMVQLLEQGHWDADLIEELTQVMRDASICGLGQAAPNPVQSVLTHFAEDLRVPRPD